MGSYRIVFKRSVAKDLRGIPNREVRRILERIDALGEDPRAEGCIKLSARERYRVRQGVYRIVYEIQDSESTVVVVRVAHRSSVYRNR
ncbi:MAG TPA: type II toxin-antitoxin system RelE/ParE family toxin [Sedimenticola thiotaurini]|uniref:Type II toxin-antitoxin system RelE/ParE family toxin n=1 Tax=Sedimenticola thiotaurini TaxID=1543721 RepID=A0A831W9L7_9GAMM|nr:type II toxin-antitoxin system RelE/ParE family toxin [Sedimenticola thiotaurini]